MITDQDIGDRLRELARATDASPRPSAEQLERVLARRQRGDRMALPHPPARAGVLRWVVPLTIAAGLLLFTRSAPHEPEVRGMAAATDTVASEGPGLFLPPPLMAEISTHPRFQTLRDPSGLRLKPGRWFYQQTSSILGGNPRGVSGWAITRGEYQGRPAWLFLWGSGPNPEAVAWADTMWMTRDSLREIARVGRLGDGGRVEEIYSDDGVMVGETHNGYTSWTGRTRRSYSHEVKGGVIIRPYSLLTTFLTTDLGPEWNGSLEFPGVYLDGSTLRHYLDVAVVRGEMVTVPAGTFDCWKVGLGREGNGFFFWVDKANGWIVKEGAEMKRGPSGEIVLIRADEE